MLSGGPSGRRRDRRSGGSAHYSAAEPTSHDFATDTYQTAAGLAAGGWDTTVLFSPKQGKAVFKESAAIGDLKGAKVTVQPATKPTFLETLSQVAKKVGPGDKVFLQVGAHGGNEGGKYVFDLVDPTSGQVEQEVSADELAAALEKIKATGAAVAVSLSSCHSGDFDKALPARLRRSEPGKKGVCVITSSGQEMISEMCMGSDYDQSGKLKSPYNKSYTAAAGFIATWFRKRARPGTGAAYEKLKNSCWADEQKHYDACLMKAGKAGIKISASSSLKEVMRAGRFCDESVNFVDSTGLASGVARVMSLLGENAESFVYGVPHGLPEPARVSPDASHEVTRAERKFRWAHEDLTAGKFEEGSYAGELVKALHPILSAYKENLVSQKQSVKEWEALAAGPTDRKARTAERKALREAHPQIAKAIDEKLAKEYARIAKFLGGSRAKSGSPPESFDNLDSVLLLGKLRKRYGCRRIVLGDHRFVKRLGRNLVPRGGRRGGAESRRGKKAEQQRERSHPRTVAGRSGSKNRFFPDIESRLGTGGTDAEAQSKRHGI